MANDLYKAIKEKDKTKPLKKDLLNLFDKIIKDQTDQNKINKLIRLRSRTEIILKDL